MTKANFVIKHKGEDYDIGKFLHFHPGGTNTVAPYRGKEISHKLDEIHHAPSAYYMMKDYKVKKGEGDDLEKYVDWSKPMLAQVGKLGKHYDQWVQSPVDRELRLFESDFLEKLSVTYWYVIPLVWVPVTSLFILKGISHNNEFSADPTFPAWVIGSFLFGVGLWSLLEYTLHRWVFHMKPPADSPGLITFHFLIHGLHHKVPFDPGRLVFPPVPAAIITSIVYLIYIILFPASLADFICAGSIAGYISYDLIHYYLHHGSPNPDSYLYEMKRYHNQHHFTEHDNGFGISSKFWDYIFGTRILLRKLKWVLRW
ncbi:fatty acid 2-hydroxylase [Schistocerca piceifrons]|uniref:fatty acid 2-hydroxylase n=1 Tax=Schistocerca piceifrons TaxID=274613 RepID=UPI001F5EEFF0|nr:fatty acid 2-hydroxylase [Schistocerca piceifrons]XP_047120123.1 fatty acid 2-hydroxylase [Schistocerca piceifrons]XP_047120124.1 fatty acid 2-hydroxylase [Schistocerca piceifrons]